MIRVFLFLFILCFASWAIAGSVTITQRPNGGFINTKFGTGFVVLTSTPTGTAPGLTGQCIGILCGVTQLR